jgi:hypothetical protein
VLHKTEDIYKVQMELEVMGPQSQVKELTLAKERNLAKRNHKR